MENVEQEVLNLKKEIANLKELILNSQVSSNQSKKESRLMEDIKDE